MNERYEDLARHIQNLLLIQRRTLTGSGYQNITQLKQKWKVSQAAERAIQIYSAELAQRRSAAAKDI